MTSITMCLFWPLVLLWIGPWIPVGKPMPTLEKVVTKAAASAEPSSSSSSSKIISSSASHGGSNTHAPHVDGVRPAQAQPAESLGSNDGSPFLSLLVGSAMGGIPMGVYKTGKGLREYNDTIQAKANGTLASDSGIPPFLGGQELNPGSHPSHSKSP
ncbi:MAG: hypothetical protein DHS80DRAFT_30733 [Piptocephalis tieghemiana]|nr:MAG: hypothetical protein DHS80DRAFT_30733 [Piptocephalis tieghemiana]